MASRGSSVRLKASGPQISQQQLVFKRFILEFVKALCTDDRKAFRFWCKGLIPRAELNVNVEDDGDIFKLIELLQDNNYLSFNDMSLLKKFLSGAKRLDLLKVLEKAELTIVVCEILDHYKFFYQGSDSAGNFYADVVQLLVSTKEKSQELFSQVLERVRRIGDKVLHFLDRVIHDYLLNPELSWSRVTALLVILAELSAEADKEDLQATTELLAERMWKLGGMNAFKLFVKEKLNLESHDCWALSSVEEKVKECLESIGHQVDK